MYSNSSAIEINSKINYNNNNNQVIGLHIITTLKGEAEYEHVSIPIFNNYRIVYCFDSYFMYIQYLEFWENVENIYLFNIET